MITMPGLVRSLSGESRNRSPPRRMDSNASKRSSHGSKRSSNGSKLAMPSLVRNRSGDSMGRRSPPRRNDSGDSKGSFKREKSFKKEKAFKKTKGFDKEITFCFKDSIRESPILSRSPESFVTFYNPDYVVRGRKIPLGETNPTRWSIGQQSSKIPMCKAESQ